MNNICVLGGKSGTVSAVNVGIGSVNPQNTLTVSGSSTNVTIASFNTSINNYCQILVQNNSASTSASADIVVTNNSGSETTNYIDLGINSTTYSLIGNIGNANDAYLYSTASHLFIGNATPTKNLYLFAGSLTNTSSFVLSSSGNVGIGVVNPFNTLQVQGNISASAFTGSVSASLIVVTNLTASLITGSFSGSHFGTSSFATTALNLLGSITSASYATSGSYVLSASNATNAQTSSYFTGSRIVVTSLTSSTITSSIIIVGSLTGSFTGSFSGSHFGTSSYASNVLSSSYALTASFIDYTTLVLTVQVFS